MRMLSPNPNPPLNPNSDALKYLGTHKTWPHSFPLGRRKSRRVFVSSFQFQNLGTDPV